MSSSNRCVYCQEVIYSVRFQCAKCPGYQLCSECFSCGVESGSHKRTHDYEILDDGYRPIFTTEDSKDWTAKQELALIEGIEQFGLGNWESISSMVAGKSAAEVKEHFESHYLSGTIGAHTRVKDQQYKITDHTGPLNGPLSPTISAPLPPLHLTQAEAMELGFLPLRDDFEREWDNDAEQVLSSAMLHHEDEEVDVAYKLSLVSMYRLRLKERNRRKRVARDYSLVNVYTSSFKKGQSGCKKRSAREYKEFQDKMKKFAQFTTMAEHDAFFHNLQKEKQLKSRIKELMRYRRNGISSQADSLEFDKESQRREKNRELAKKKVNHIIDTPRRSAVQTTPTPKPEKRVRQTPVLQKLEPISDVLRPHHDNPRSPRSPKSPVCRESLSDTEKRLCRSIGMKAASYVTLKTCILRDYLTRQHGTPVKLRFPSGFDKTHRRTILNFLEHSGWIQLEN